MQLKGQPAAMPASVAISAEGMGEPFAPPAAFKDELSAYVVWQVEHLHRLGQYEFLGGKPERILFGVLLNVKDLQLRRVLHLHQQRRTQRHIKAGRVQQFFVVRHDHALGEAQLTDLVIS